MEVPVVSVPNSSTLWMSLFLNNHFWIFCTSYAIILSINKASKMKMSPIAGDDFVKKNNFRLVLFLNSFTKLPSICVVGRLYLVIQLNFVSLKIQIFHENTL